MTPVYKMCYDSSFSDEAPSRTTSLQDYPANGITQPDIDIPFMTYGLLKSKREKGNMTHACIIAL